MKAAEFFVDLGVKGQDKTLGAVMQIKGGLKETAATSLEAKAAILGVMYTMQRFFAESSHAGQGLANFNSTTGVAAKTLQQYQFAARQVGVANSAVEGSFRSLQNTMTKTLLGGAAPTGLGRFAQIMGDVNTDDLEEWARAPEKLLDKLQQYANKEKSLPLRNEVLKSFGLDQGMIDAMNRNAFRPDVLKRAPTYSDGEIKQLDIAAAAWANLGTKIEMAAGRFNAKHGGQLVQDISKITDQVIKLTESFTVLAEKLHFFELIGKAFEGWSIIFDGWAKATDIVAKEAENGKTAKTAQGQMAGPFGNIISNILGMIGEEAMAKVFPGAKILRDPVGPQPQSGGKTTNDNSTKQDIKVNQTFNNYGQDAAGQASTMKKAVNEAFRAQPQGRSN